MHLHALARETETDGDDVHDAHTQPLMEERYLLISQIRDSSGGEVMEKKKEKNIIAPSGPKYEFYTLQQRQNACYTPEQP